MAVGAPARVRIDGLGGRTLAARVVEIRHQAEYLPRNVQTLDQRSDQVFAVKVALERPAPDASPGPRPWPRPGMAAFVELEPMALDPVALDPMALDPVALDPVPTTAR